MMRIQFASGLSFLLYYCSYLNIQTSLASAHCLDDQRSLLLQLKNNLTFNPLNSNKLVLWNQSLEPDCCNWKGVSCDKQGHVTALDLSEEYISGELYNSSSLFNLIDLQNLNLAYNQFNCVIPFGFQKLTKLSYLNLSNTGFVGQIPIEISHLTRLVVLDISTDFIDIHTAFYSPLKLENPNLAKFLQNLTQVRELYLDGIDISNTGNEWCKALSSSLPDLQVLSMSNSNLGGPIDSSLQALKSLSVIRLENNPLSAPVPEFFAKFSNLTTLYLSHCWLSGTFPQDMFKVQTLTSLDISYNYGLDGYLPDFPQNGSLQTLRLSYTNFAGAIPNSISNIRKLSILECDHCQFNGTLPTSISTLKELTYLDLSNNNFRGYTPSFGMAKKLTCVDLSVNDLSGPISSAHFEGLLHLASIDLSSNNLEGPIPKSIFHLSNLIVLYLSSNKFNGTVQLDMIHNLKNLTALDFSHNNLSVDVNISQTYLSSFPNITNLGLASCNLRVFPIFLINQSMLDTLDLSNNQIQGRIPNWIWKLDFLQELNLSSNLFTGLEAPLWNSKSKLIVLDLHSNKFQGQLPVFPSNIIYLDWSNNKFNSVIPHDVVDLSSLTFFSLSNNDLHGSIPNSFCNSSNLHFLDLSHNKFSGTIPQCLDNGFLNVLNVRDNMLNGSLLDTFSASYSLQILDLHGNQLGGQLPKSLANCKMLEVLDLGKNQILDFFPCWLGNISTLRVLILKNNKFHGAIECPQMKGSWQMLQIVDVSANKFEGLLPHTLFTTWKAMVPDEDHAVYDLEILKEQGSYYYDSITVTMKGHDLQLDKILNTFTSIDFSSNHFNGPIPEELMNLEALLGLNLSYNSLSGRIPSSVGNLRQLESLDLSKNLLDGEIPTQLANLNFLSFLNLSFNNLEGIIPTGTQIQSFETTSFEGNENLCGPPLTMTCSKGMEHVKSNSTTGSSFSWNFISFELGFTFGIEVIFLPLLFWKQWRLWYWKFVEDILHHIFPQLDYVHESHGGKSYRTLRWKPC